MKLSAEFCMLQTQACEALTCCCAPLLCFHQGPGGRYLLPHQNARHHQRHLLLRKSSHCGPLSEAHEPLPGLQVPRLSLPAARNKGGRQTQTAYVLWSWTWCDSKSWGPNLPLLAVAVAVAVLDQMVLLNYCALNRLMCVS
jgi:hypothetical protein